MPTAKTNQPAETNPAHPEFTTGGISDVGTVREDNQDTIYFPDGPKAPEDGYLFAVADGMGGYAHGGMASSLAIQAVSDAYYGHANRTAERSLQVGVEMANLKVFQAAQQLGVGRMGTTLTAVGIRGRKLHLAHVGDSRAYLVRDGQLTCLTRDHTAVGDLVRMKVISPDRVRTHAQRSILNRAVGLTMFVQPDLSDLELKEGDRLILCTDGVWSALEDDDLGKIARQAREAEKLSQDLVARALEEGSDDNASVVSIFIHSLAHVPAQAPNRARWKWLQVLRGL
jgi:PPM family protein phosphatase